MDKLDLSLIEIGDHITFTTNDQTDVTYSYGRRDPFFHHGSSEHRYDFLVAKPGDYPKGLLSETQPNGELIGPTEAVLTGSGDWLTWDQNPAQTRLPTLQLRIIGALCLGSFVTFRGTSGPEANSIYTLRQPISEIQLNGRNIAEIEEQPTAGKTGRSRTRS